MRKKNIVKNTLILTTAGLITKILGMLYRIYMANAIGALGMGLYQLIIPIYILAWSISCAGFTTTISKLVASEKAKGNNANIKRILTISICLSLIVSIILSISLYVFAPIIANGMYKDARLIMPLRVLSLGIVFMALGSCIRGYFIGIQQTLVPAISQVVEQVARMLTIYLLAGLFIPKGVEYACTLAIIGIVVSEFVAFMFVYASLRNSLNKTFITTKSNLDTKKATMLIMSMALPLTGNRMTSSLLSAFENMLIPIKLQQYGLSATDSIAEFGKITGMALPLIFFPSALLTAISISLVPAISEAVTKKDFKSINYTVSKILLYTVIIGCLAGVTFVTFRKPLGLVIYKEDISVYLFAFGLLCPLMYVQIIMSGVLNGLGEQLFIFKNSIISSIIIISIIYFFMPTFGISAFLVSLFISSIVISFMEVIKINSICKIKIDVHSLFILPMLCAIFSGLMCKLVVKLNIIHIGNSFVNLAFYISLLSIFYFVMIVIVGCIKISEIKYTFDYIKKYFNKKEIDISAINTITL